MAEVQFSNIIQVATIGLTLATLKLGLEQFLTRSLIAERQDILNREKEFENEHNEAIEELQKTTQQDPEAIEPQNENNLARYHSKQEDLQAFDIKYFLNSSLLHVAIVVVYAISVYFAAIQFSEMPYLFQLNSWIFKKLTLEYSAVTIFNCTALTFIFQSVVLAHFVAKTIKLRRKLHKYSSDLSSLSKLVSADISLMKRTIERAQAHSTL
jgi:hypothetical protein